MDKMFRESSKKEARGVGLQEIVLDSVVPELPMDIEDMTFLSTLSSPSRVSDLSSIQIEDIEAGNIESDTRVQIHQPADVLEAQRDCAERNGNITNEETRHSVASCAINTQEQTLLKDEDALSVGAMLSGGISLAEVSCDVQAEDNGDTRLDVAVCR